MTVNSPTKAVAIKRARSMREHGVSLKRIAKRLQIGEATAWEWTADIPGPGKKKKSRVGEDENGVWRIYIYQPAAVRTPTYAEPQKGVYWWPLEWAGWPTKEMAQAFLDKHGDYQAKEGPCSTTA